MRSFGNELIEALRVLLLLKSAPDSAGLLDLADSELTECRALAEGTDITTLQRLITILLRTDSDMAHSSHSRLLLEMALIRMATLTPVIQIDELLERLKALESTAPPAVIAGEPTTLPYRPTPAARRTVSAAAPAAASPAPQDAPVLAAVPGSTTRDWPGFVAFVKTGKPLLASKLEKGSPLDIADGMLRLGYPQGSLELSMLQEADSLQQLTELAASYYGRPVVVKIVPLSGSEESLPPSIEEKKSAESARNEQEMKNSANSHPLVKAALEIFGGEIVAYRR
jgi:DNA polymerase-3 subunit gamma/tau